jgi:hypothetical protein
MSEYLMKAARKLAEGGDFPVPRTVEEAAILERIRSSLWPQPTLIDRRSVSVNIAQQGLSPGAIEKLEVMAETDVKGRPPYVAPGFEGKCKISRSATFSFFLFKNDG